MSPIDQDTDRNDPDADERDRRSGASELSPWVIVMLILILAAAVYVGSAVLK